MKARGIFAITAMLAALAASTKRFFAVQSHSTGEGRIKNGRDSFLSVSTPRCHTQKKIYRGFA